MLVTELGSLTGGQRRHHQHLMLGETKARRPWRQALDKPGHSNSEPALGRAGSALGVHLQHAKPGAGLAGLAGLATAERVGSPVARGAERCGAVRHGETRLRRGECAARPASPPARPGVCLCLLLSRHPVKATPRQGEAWRGATVHWQAWAGTTATPALRPRAVKPRPKLTRARPMTPVSRWALAAARPCPGRALATPGHARGGGLAT